MVQGDTSAGGGLVSDGTGNPALPLRAGSLLMRDVIDMYMSHYEGRDPTRLQRLGWWKRRVGHVALQDLSDDEVHSALEDLAQRRSSYFAGSDVDGRAVFRDKGKPVSGATINRYHASLAAVCTWTIRRRVAPKAWPHPCRSVERRPENSGRVRFLSADERERLLAACRVSKWPRLYMLVVMALTTGARKGELQGLLWRDVDLEQGLATIGRTKNGDARMLALVPAVVAEMRRFHGKPGERVFPATHKPLQAYAFEGMWKEAMRDAKVRAFRFHDTRHSCASMLAANGATLLEIADVLGHRQLQMTKRYSHLATSHKAALVRRVLGDIA